MGALKITFSGGAPPGRQTPHGISRAVLPICTAWVRRLAPSLSNSRLEWVFTVFSLTNSRPAISRLLNPLAMSPRISSSRAVMPSSLTRISSAANGPRGRRRDFLEDHRRFLSGECLPEPDAQSRKQRRDQRAVDFDGMLDYQEPVLRPLQHGNQEPTD